MSLNDLPTLIDGPGMYRTRDGKLIQIHGVVHNPDPTTTMFGAKGSVLKSSKNGLRPCRYDVWHVSGRWTVLSESGMDIVKKENQ